MSGEIRDELSQALKKIDRPGSICVAGSAPLVLPGLEVNELGPVGLPLTDKQAIDLIKLCDQAPYGKGEQTIVDPSIRRVWRMTPGRFALTNPDWNRFLAAMVAKVQTDLGLEEQKLESHLYDLLLYEPGSFFLAHRDGEKLDRMVATLVVVLPSSHEGGELVVRHDGLERTIDFQDVDANPFHIHFAAFYADCEHEVRPLRKGYRLCLVYNLTLEKATKTISAPRDSEHIDQVGRLLGKWATDDSARKLAITLEHQYTRDGIAWDALKGVDRAKARILREGARQADCRIYLALLTLWESGSSEDADDGEFSYGRGRRWHEGHHREDRAREYTMDEVYDTSLTAAHWCDSSGHALPLGKLSVDEDDVLDPESLRGVHPEQSYEGYTGNEGMTLERWYRRAAIFVWPERRHFEIICDRDSRKVVPELKEMVEEWQRSKAKARARDAAVLKSQCLEFAGAEILAKWPENRYAPADRKDTRAGDMLEAIAALDAPRLIGAFLDDLMIKDASVEPGSSLVAVCREHGWGTFQKELQTVMKSMTNDTMERDVRLLEQVCSADPGKTKDWGELCVVLAQELVSTVETIDRAHSSTDWRSRNADRAEIVAGLARSLLVTGQFDLLARVVAHVLATPHTYPLTTAHMPALVNLQPWLKPNVRKPCPALTHWLGACREQLESLTARAPQEPKDFRRPAAIACECQDCAELKKFLQDPHEPVHRFRAKEERRKHLEHQVGQHRCDLNLKTERSGSPHTLVCTKNTASYQGKLKKYHQAQEHLATVQSIEAGLPG